MMDVSTKKFFLPKAAALALAAVALLSLEGCTNGRRKSPNVSSSRVLVTTPLVEGVFTITTLNVPSGGSQIQVNFSSAAGQPSLLSFCSGDSEPVEGGSPGETRACACAFSWSEMNTNNGTAIAYTRTAYSELVPPVQAYRGVCALPVAWTSGEIAEGTRVKVKIVPGAGNPVGMTMDAKEIRKGTALDQFDFTDSEGRGFVNVHRYSCLQKPEPVGLIRSKVPSTPVATIEPSRYSTDAFWQQAPAFSLKASSATDFCIGNGRDPNNPNGACPQGTASRDVGAQSFYFSMYLPSTNLGRISYENVPGGVYCPQVRETLRTPSVASAWPLDTHFALAKSKSSEFSIPIETRAVLRTADPNTAPTSCVGSGSSGSAIISNQCLGWAAKPNSDGTCNAFRDQSGTLRQTYRLRRYIARMPDRFKETGKVDRRINFDEVYVLDRPVDGSPDPLKPFTMAGPKPCPFAYYDHSGVTGEAPPIARYLYSPARPESTVDCRFGDTTAGTACVVSTYSDGTTTNLTARYLEAPNNNTSTTTFNTLCDGDKPNERCEIPGCRFGSNPLCNSQFANGTRRLALPGIHNPDRMEGGFLTYRKQLYGLRSYTCQPGDVCISLLPFNPSSPEGGNICLNLKDDPRAGGVDVLCKGVAVDVDGDTIIESPNQDEVDEAGLKQGFIEAVGLGGDGDGLCENGEFCMILNRTQLTAGGSGGLCRPGDSGCHALGIPGYKATSNACWAGKNPDNAHFPNFDAFLAGVNGSVQNIYRYSCSATMPIIRYTPETGTPLHLILSTSHRSNPHVENLGGGRKVSMHTVYRRPIDPHWITYAEDHEFQACAPLSQASGTQDILDPPLHFAKDTQGNVSWCAMTYPTRNEAAWEIDRRPGAMTGEQSPGYVQNYTSSAVKNSTSAVCGPSLQPLQNLPGVKTSGSPLIRFYPSAGACQDESTQTDCDGLWPRNYCKGAAHHPSGLKIDVTVDTSAYPFGASPVDEFNNPLTYNNPLTGQAHRFIGANNACNRTIAYSGSGFYEFPLQAPARDIEEVLRKDPSFNCTVTWDNGGGKAGVSTPLGGCCNRNVVPGPSSPGKSVGSALTTGGGAGNPIIDTGHLEPDQLCGRPNYN
jgi:hypothetical protein